MKLTLIFAGIATTMGAALPAPNTLVARDVAGTCQIPDHGLTPYNMANTSGRCYNIPFNSGANAAYVHDSYVCQFFSDGSCQNKIIAYAGPQDRPMTTNFHSFQCWHMI